MSKIDLTKLSRVQLGDFGESFFATEALKRGLSISKPFGSQMGYDYILENGQNLLRVQVRCVGTYKKLRASRQTRQAMVNAKKPRHYDFLFVIDLVADKVYVVPEKDLAGSALIINSKQCTQYLDAWHLLK